MTALRRAIGRQILRQARPLRDRRRDERGRCNVCGATSRHVYNSWILPRPMVEEWGDERIEEAFVRRESLFCARCGSSLRVRGLVDVLLATYGAGAATLEELVRAPAFRALRIAEINSIGVVHPYLSSHPRLEYSEYRDDAEPGLVGDGVRNEDVCRLSYADASFDLVLTSDTLEHVPDFRAAFREIRRVLVPGGRHVFTIPVVPGREHTVARVSAGPDGARMHHLPALFHGRGSGLLALVSSRSDYLTWTEFGLDVVDELAAAGFESEVHGEGAALVFSARAGGLPTGGSG